MEENLESVRLDRWLSAARFYKTRTQAAKACIGRKVKVNGITAKPHKFIHVGDKITIHHHGRYRNIEVVSLAQRGLPASEARKLYIEESRNRLPREMEDLIDIFRKAEKKSKRKAKGRPTKKERREIEKFKRKITL